jgi:hypothetical protein
MIFFLPLLEILVVIVAVMIVQCCSYGFREGAEMVLDGVIELRWLLISAYFVFMLINLLTSVT